MKLFLLLAAIYSLIIQQCHTRNAVSARTEVNKANLAGVNKRPSSQNALYFEQSADSTPTSQPASSYFQNALVMYGSRLFY